MLYAVFNKLTQKQKNTVQYLMIEHLTGENIGLLLLLEIQVSQICREILDEFFSLKKKEGLTVF